LGGKRILRDPSKFLLHGHAEEDARGRITTRSEKGAKGGGEKVKRSKKECRVPKCRTGGNKKLEERVGGSSKTRNHRIFHKKGNPLEEPLG